MFAEYPKSLYRGTVEDHLIVNDKEQEAAARADGYEMYAEIHARAEEPAPAKRGRPAKDKAE
jgi:hypothetical protein